MAAYGIGVGRILIAAIESARDKGIIWPALFSPYSVVYHADQHTTGVKQGRDKLYAELNARHRHAAGDRDARPV